VGCEKTFAQEVAHALYLNFGFLIIFRIGLQYVLNDGGIGGDDGLFQATQVELEGVAILCDVFGQNLYRIAGHRARIGKGLKSGNNGYS
jgi:hypothetical protein